MHVFNTWLIANAIHPLLLVILFLSGPYAEITEEGIVMGFVFFMVSTVCSLPCLFAANGVMWFVKRLTLDPIRKFILWLLLCSLLPSVNVLLIAAVSAGQLLTIYDLAVTLPATIAVFITIMLRIKPFLLHINPFKEINQ